MKIEIPYYEDNSRISNSAIGWFLKKGPRYLKDMLDGKEEGLSAKYLEKGTMIHMYLLQPEEFWDNYIILDYIEYLEKKDFKTVISFADLNMLKNIKRNIENHKKANELLNNDITALWFNEFHINWEDTKHNVSCKSLLDRVIFDHENKKITLIDLKTTADVYNFKHSVEEYDYYRQIAFYILALTWYMEIEKEIDISDYDLEAYIIAIQSNGSNEVRVFNMLNEKELSDRKDLISNALSDISYHFQTGNWDHTRKYYEENGVEEL